MGWNHGLRGIINGILHNLCAQIGISSQSASSNRAKPLIYQALTCHACVQSWTAILETLGIGQEEHCCGPGTQVMENSRHDVADGKSTKLFCTINT